MQKYGNDQYAKIGPLDMANVAAIQGQKKNTQTLDELKNVTMACIFNTKPTEMSCTNGPLY